MERVSKTCTLAHYSLYLLEKCVDSRSLLRQLNRLRAEGNFSSIVFPTLLWI